jgi:hypothetical protein
MAGLSEIQATTWEYREKKPADAVADNIPMLFALRKKGRVTTINGGRVIWEDIKYAQNAYVQRIDPTEEITLGYNQTITGFEYSPKIIVVPVVVNALEKAQNQGDAQFLDLLEQRNQVAEDSLMNNMETDLQGDGTGFGGKAFAGIQSYIVTNVTSGSYGGLARTSYSSIRNAAVNAPSTFTGATDSSNIESRLRYSKNLVVRNGGPELCLAGQNYYNAACDAMSAKQRFTQNQEMFEAGFDNVVIEGMTMVLAGGKSFSGGARIAADRCYGVRLENYALKMYKGFNFQPVPERVSVNQLVDISITVGIGQFTCNGAGLSFVMHDS